MSGSSKASKPADEPVRSDTPMWLSHHWPADYDRCVHLGGRHVCRRCLVLYPVAAWVAALGAAGESWPRRFDGWLLWLLVVPATVELCAEQAGLTRHSPLRLVAVTLPLAVGCGALYRRYIDRPGDGLVWAIVGVCGGLCLAAIAARSLRPRRPSP